MIIKQRLVFHLQVLVVPDIPETKNLRMPELLNHKDMDTKVFLAMEPDGNYRLGDVLADMMVKAEAAINQLSGNPLPKNKMCFMEFTVMDAGSSTGIDLG